MSFFGQFFNRDKSNSKFNPLEEVGPREPAMPYPVRYALKTGHVLDKLEVMSLVRDGDRLPDSSPSLRPESAHVALYLLIKAFEKDTEEGRARQRAILRGLTLALYTHKNAQAASTREVVRDFVEKELEARFPNDLKVNAHNLGEMYSKGLFLWDSLYRKRAAAAANDTRAVFILGHATFLGLAHFILEFQKVGKPLYILMPNQIRESNSSADARNYPFGYVIDPKGDANAGANASNELVRNMNVDDVKKTQGAVVIDDVESSGATKELIREFIVKMTGATSIDFDPMNKVNL